MKNERFLVIYMGLVRQINTITMMLTLAAFMNVFDDNMMSGEEVGSRSRFLKTAKEEGKKNLYRF
jgi:hypothetical protein